MEKEKSKRYEGLSTKIDPAMWQVLNSCCDALGVDVYHLLQWFAYTIVRAAAPMHELDPRIQRLLTMMESDAGWQEAFNLACPDRLKVAQMILVLEQEGHKGFGAVMIEKPFMGTARQTENSGDIAECVLEATNFGRYLKMRKIGAWLGGQRFNDIIDKMLEKLIDVIRDEDLHAHLPGMGEHAENLKKMAYGKKTKRQFHRTPDSVASDQRVINFDDYNATTTDV